ncbi:MAG: hypothetical protein RIR27_781 [Pseudomonadota bacterium]
MGKLFSINLIFVVLSSLIGIGHAFARANEDLVMVLDGKQYSIAYYKSSIKSLPPEWKKVWIITNRKASEEGSRVMSSRRNILFNCVRNTYSTLATINYAEPMAAGRPVLQTDSGFDLSDEPVPEGSPLAIVQSQVCAP